jgi:hypothetical protein
MPEQTIAQATQCTKESRVCRALDSLLEHGRVFRSDFSGSLTLDVEIRNGGVQDVRLTKRVRDQQSDAQESRKAA